MTVPDWLKRVCLNPLISKYTGIVYPFRYPTSLDIVREYNVENRHVFNIIVLKLIPPLGYSIGSLETPPESGKKLAMKKLGFRATPFYLCFKPKVNTETAFRNGVEKKLRALECRGSSH